jgi:cytochrome P450
MTNPEKLNVAVAAPGPRGFPLLGVLPRMRRDPLGLFLECMHEHGDVVRFRLGPIPCYLINSPEYLKRILLDNRSNYRLGSAYEKLRPIFGNSVSMSEDPDWSRQRKLLQPGFHHTRIAALGQVVVEEAEAELPSLRAAAEAGRSLDMAEGMLGLAMRVVVKAMFGQEISSDNMVVVRDSLAALNEDMNRRFYALIDVPLFIPTPANRRFNKALAAIEHVISTFVAAVRQRPAGQSDLLAMLLEARYEDTGEGMNEKQIRDEVMTIFGAGHETTGTVMGWVLHLLARHSEVDARLREEIRVVLGDRPPRFEDMASMPYLKMVIQETMRLYPPAWSFLRTSLQADRLGPYRIDPGALIFLCPFTMHRDSRYWENPEQFQPERFSPERFAAIPKYAYFPFGGGPRVCIGQSFAMMEMMLALPLILQRFRFHAQAGEVELNPLVTLQAKGGLWLRPECI